MLPPSWKAEVQKTVEGAAAADKNQREAQQNEASTKIAAAINALRDAQAAQTTSEDANEKRNQAINKATLILVAFTVLFTGLSWLAFREQLAEMQKVYGPIKESADAAKTAADAAWKQAGAAEKQVTVIQSQLAVMELSQRAWVSVKIEKDGDFTYSLEKGVQIPLNVTISNVGHEPAFNILPAVGFLSFIWVGDDGKNIPITDRQKQICDKVKVNDPARPESIGQSLLPSETRTFPVFKVGMDQKEFKTLLERSNAKNAPLIFMPLIGGCFNYTFINGEGGIHQTGFIYSIDRKDNWAFRFDKDGNGVTKLDEMNLEPWAGAGFGFFAN